MKKISVWMLALMLVPGLVLLAGCKKAEDADNAAAGEPMAAEAPPTPYAAEPMLEATPLPTPMAATTWPRSDPSPVQ